MKLLNDVSPIEAVQIEEGRELVWSILQARGRNADRNGAEYKSIQWLHRQLGFSQLLPGEVRVSAQVSERGKFERQFLRGKPASTIFYDFVDPIVQEWSESKKRPDVKDLNQMCELPMMIWNAVILEQRSTSKSGRNALSELRQGITNSQLGMEMIFEGYVTRKKLMFDDYRYLIGEFRFKTDKAGRLAIEVQSRIPPTAQLR